MGRREGQSVRGLMSTWISQGIKWPGKPLQRWAEQLMEGLGGHVHEAGLSPGP